MDVFVTGIPSLWSMNRCVSRLNKDAVAHTTTADNRALDLLVVRGAIILEVSILDGSISHDARGAVQLLISDLAPLFDCTLALELGFIQQLNQTH